MKDLQPYPNHLMSVLSDMIINAEQEVLIKVLSQIIKKDPIQEDYKRITILTQDNEFTWYDVAFDNVTIGRVIKDFGDNNWFDAKRAPRYSITFHPIDYDKYDQYLHLPELKKDWRAVRDYNK